MEKKYEITRKLIIIGGGEGITLPKEIQKYLNIKVGDKVTLQIDNGKHGPFIAFWKKKESATPCETNEQAIKEIEQKRNQQ